SAGAGGAKASAWSTSAPARRPTPSARAPPWSGPTSPPTRPAPSWTPSARGAAFAPPARSPGAPGTPAHATSPKPAARPRASPTSGWPYRVETSGAQLDEKWSFVAKKQKNTDPEGPRDDDNGDDWDHPAVDPEHRLLLAVGPGERSAQNCKKVVQEVYDRTA